MIRARVRHFLPVCAAGLLLLTPAWSQGRGRKYKPPPPTCKINVTVVKAVDGKPVTDAAVVFQPIENNKIRGNMELKTDGDGKTSLNMIPIGDNVLLQVIATGFRTYGKIYELPGDTKDITVKLNPPATPYSIYQKHPDQNEGSGQQEQKDKQQKQNPQQ